MSDHSSEQETETPEVLVIGTSKKQASNLLATLLYVTFLVWAILLAGRAGTARVLNYMAALILPPLYVLAYYMSLQ